MTACAARAGAGPKWRVYCVQVTGRYAMSTCPLGVITDADIPRIVVPMYKNEAIQSPPHLTELRRGHSQDIAAVEKDFSAYDARRRINEPHHGARRRAFAASAPPSWEHWFGVDHLGRDIFSRVVYGARISLWIGLFSVGISLTIGTTLGLIAGYFGGFVDNLIMRVMDIMMALPHVLLAILIATILGPSLENGILAIGIVRVPRFARLARASTLSVRTLTYVEASVAIGAPHHRIIFRDVLPNIVGPIVVYSTLSLGESILSAAVLSFLGLGAQPPVPEWGAMLNEAQKYLINAPFMSIFPGLAIFLTVLSFNLLGDGLRDILDPRVRR